MTWKKPKIPTAARLAVYHSQKNVLLLLSWDTVKIWMKVCTDMCDGIARFTHLYAIKAQSVADKYTTFRGEIFFSQDTDCSGQIGEMGQRGIIYRMVTFLQLNSLFQHN